MVRKDCHAHRFIPLCHLIEDWTHGTMVEHLDAAFLQLGVTFVTSLIGCFDVEEDKVALAKFFDGSLCLCLIVGVPQTSCSRHLDLLQAAIDTYAEDEIDCRDHCSAVDLVGEELVESLHRRTIAQRPRPDAVGHILAFGCTALVDRMLWENLHRLEHEGSDECAGLDRSHAGVVAIGSRLWHVVAPRLAYLVVRRGALDVLVASANLEQVAIAHAREETHDGRLTIGSNGRNTVGIEFLGRCNHRIAVRVEV